MMKYALTTATLFAMLLSGAALAFENEPDGFRNIKWGADFSANAKELTLVQKDADTRYYLRKGEKHVIGGAKLGNIIYAYTKGKFMSVSISTTGIENKTAIIKSFRAQFGEPDQPNEYIEKFLWLGESTRILLDCNSITDECTASIFSTKFLIRKHAEDEKAAAGAGKDF